MYRSASGLFLYKTESALYAYALNNTLFTYVQTFFTLVCVTISSDKYTFYGICIGRKKLNYDILRTVCREVESMFS